MPDASHSVYAHRGAICWPRQPSTGRADTGTQHEATQGTKLLSHSGQPIIGPRNVRQQVRNSSVRYAVAIFLSSSLLFLSEPIAGKRLLPLLGGSAAVWTACLVFFQSALLLGYVAAHWLVTRASSRSQVAVYVGLLVLSLAQLTLAIDPPLHADSAHPITSVLWLLTILIGVPFLTLSATSPLLQAWYARSSRHGVTREGAARETVHPYRLFAVSNVGSLLALLIYPWLIEPRLSLHVQTAALAVGFAMLAVRCCCPR